MKDNPELAARIKWAEVSTATDFGSKKAAAYGIRSVPTIILTNKKGEKGGFVGAPTKKTYLNIVNEMLK